MQRFNEIVDRFAREIQDFSFVVIGANDGMTGDPIYPFIRKYGWKGVLVEPQANRFSELVRNFRDQDGLAFENAAIAETPGKVVLNTCGELGMGSSLMPDEYFLEVKPQAFANRQACGGTVPVEVDAITLEDLLGKHGIKRVDMFSIDVEGYDFNIIKMIDFEHHRPSLINYESDKLGDRKQLCERLLKAHGYQLHHHGLDTLAYLDSRED